MHCPNLRRALLGAVALLAGCSWSALTDPPLDPSLALVDVQSALDEVAERGASGDDPEVVSVWSRAHRRFEKDLEPVLRERVGRVAVAQAEYQFGRVLHDLQTGADPRADAERLQGDLSDLVDRLTPTVASR